MRRFGDWFNETAAHSKTALPALTQAGIAHLYFESIHPFEDGNGRLGRAIAEKALAQGLEQGALVALSATLLAHRRAYYDALEAANKSSEINGWLLWFAGIALEAQQRTLAQTELVIKKVRFFEKFRDAFNERQQKALLRLFRAGPDGFQCGLSAGNYIAITGASQSTATRDLADLANKGALIKTGELKRTRYFLP